ncbi:MAG TPA: AI-2E family transporter [Longimicrobiaceae bacterium]|nr:AI-2E family transporter [Longimicrobiaceae bacterium]
MADGVVRRITWRTSDVARVLTLAALFLFAWRFFWMVYNAFFLGLLAILIAIVIHAPARYLARWIPFGVAFGLVVTVFVGAIAGLAVVLVPQVVEQVGVLAGQIPAAMDSAAEWVEQKSGSEPNAEVASRINEQIGEFVGRFVPLAFNLISAALGSFAVVTLAIFLAAQPEVYRGMLLRTIAPDSRDKWALIYDEAGRNLRNWVLGKAFTMLLIGVATYVGLTLFGLPGALALAALAALLEFIPNFGPTIAALPAIVTAFGISPLTALYVAIFYFVLQQVQNAITVPLVERRAVNIPPAALLAWQLMLTIGFGLLALFVATPLLAVIVVAVRILYLEPLEARQAWDRREALPAAAAPVEEPSGEAEAPPAPPES